MRKLKRYCRCSALNEADDTSTIPGGGKSVPYTGSGLSPRDVDPARVAVSAVNRGAATETELVYTPHAKSHDELVSQYEAEISQKKPQVSALVDAVRKLVAKLDEGGIDVLDFKKDVSKFYSYDEIVGALGAGADVKCPTCGRPYDVAPSKDTTFKGVPEGVRQAIAAHLNVIKQHAGLLKLKGEKSSDYLRAPQRLGELIKYAGSHDEVDPVKFLADFNSRDYRGVRGESRRLLHALVREMYTARP